MKLKSHLCTIILIIEKINNKGKLKKANTTFAKNKFMHDWDTVLSDIK